MSVYHDSDIDTDIGADLKDTRYLSSGTLCYMISYMISKDNDIDYDIICFEMSMISHDYDII